MWWVGAAVVLVGAALYWQIARPKSFDYRGKRYTRHSDGTFTYSDGGSLDDENERQEVQDHWDSSHDSSSSDGGSDGGGGDGGGGGGD